MFEMKFGKIKEIFKRLPRVMVEHAFLSFLILVFFALIFGGILFYKYMILAKLPETEIYKKPIQFQEDLYLRILVELEDHQKRFEEVGKKIYPDPFMALTE